jgi:hypothetical protein
LENVKWENKKLVAKNARLSAEIDQKDRRLLEVPRLEEQYLRNARGIISKNNEDVVLREIKWRK